MAFRGFLVVFFILCSFLYADENEEEIIVLPSTATVNSDYFANGRTVEISGRVNGDVYVFGGQVFMDGVIDGDLLVAGGSVEISGTVTKNVRLLAGQALITGNIGQNVTAVTATIELSPSSSVGRNIIVVSGNTDLESKVGNNVRLYSSSARISDGIHGKVLAYVGNLRLTSKVNIGGELEYWSNKAALIDPNAKVKGGVIHHPSFFYDLLHGKIFRGLKIGSKLAVLLMNFFYSFIIGLIMLRYFPQRIEQTLATLNKKPAQSLVAGVVLLFLLPVTMLVLLVTILGAPFALALLSLTVVGLYSAKVFAVFWMSTHIFRKFELKKHRKLYFTFGLIVYFIVTLIPYAGTIVTVAALLFGLGGAALGKIDRESKGPIARLLS